MSATVPMLAQKELMGSAESFCDFSLGDLSAEARLQLNKWKPAHWTSSARFAESYCYPPAQRISYIKGADGEIVEACFYREEKWAGVFKSISMTCRVDPGSTILQNLERHRSADLIRAPFLDALPHASQSGARDGSSIQRMADDYIIELPASAGEYLSRLGASTRKHLPYYLRRLKKEWGSDLRVEHTSGSQITKESYRDLLALNRLRMNRKRRTSLWTEKIADHRWELVRDCGSLECIRHKGRLTAGTLSFGYGGEAYLVVIAHDPELDRLNLGNLCLWLTIEDLIARGFSRYHLLWGNSPYKEQFGATAHPLYEMTLFMSPRVAGVWRVAGLLKVAKFWSLAKSAARKLGWLLSDVRRVYSSQDGSE